MHIGIVKLYEINIFDNYFQYPSHIHSYDTGYAGDKIFISHALGANIGNQSVSSIIVVGLWQDVPASLKNLKTLNGNAKEFLYKTQIRKKMIGFICA